MVLTNAAFNPTIRVEWGTKAAPDYRGNSLIADASEDVCVPETSKIYYTSHLEDPVPNLTLSAGSGNHAVPHACFRGAPIFAPSYVATQGQTTCSGPGHLGSVGLSVGWTPEVVHRIRYTLTDPDGGLVSSGTASEPPGG